MLSNSTEITWVAIDPGDSRYSPQHIESVIRQQSRLLGIEILWLATVRISGGESRYGFVIGAQGNLGQLVEETCLALGDQARRADSEIINRVTDGIEGRFIVFPSSLKTYSDHRASELIENSAIEEISAIGEELPMDSVIATSNYLRPTLINGKIVLLVERLYTGDFAPIEKENPHQCCGGAHAPF